MTSWARWIQAAAVSSEKESAQQRAQERDRDGEQGIPGDEQDARQGRAEEVGDRGAELEGGIERAAAGGGQQGLQPEQRPAREAPAADQVEVDESHGQERPECEDPDGRV